MDNLEKDLKSDAKRIRAEVSPVLEDRIRASLEAIEPERPEPNAAPARPISLWWASSLTGIAAAAVVILVINIMRPDPAPTVAADSSGQPAQAPLFVPDLNARSADLTAPLQRELDLLESDLEKARAAVRREIGLQGDPDDAE